MIFSDMLRPSECPLCGRKHPLRKHGIYSRYVCSLLCDPILINVLRFYCPGCRHTVSVLPSFCLPNKRYSASAVSCCLQLLLACEVSLRALNKAYPAVSRVLAGVWLKQWNFSSTGIISSLRNTFDFITKSAEVCTGHKSSYITAVSLEAFYGVSDFALGYELVNCHVACGIASAVNCQQRDCNDILKVLQERFTVITPSVRLF